MCIICVTSAAWAFSFGLGSQVVTHWLNGLGYSDTVNGWCHSIYYFGLAAGSCAVPWLTRRLGAVACTTVGLLISGISLASFPWLDAAWLWFVLRFISGWAGAMCVVPLETMVSHDSSAATKTRNFALYGVAITVGGAAGIAIGLDLCGPGESIPFFLGAFPPIVAAVLCSLGMQRSGRLEHAGDVRLLDWRRNVLSYGTAWCQGFLEGGMVAFLSLFLMSRGFTKEQAGVGMGVTMIGVIVFQVPIAALADRFGRTPILLGCYAVVAATLVGIPWLTHGLLLAAVLFLFGACSGAMYPLGLALLGDRLPESALARAYAWYLAIECVGSQFGAAIMGQARDWWGESAMFGVSLAAVGLVLLLWGMMQRIMITADRRHAPRDADQPAERRAA